MANSFFTKRRIGSLAFLILGLGVAAYLAKNGPKEQNVRVVLGAGAPSVQAVDLRYVDKDNDTAAEVHFAWPMGSAPRVVPHSPKLPQGGYRLEIDLDTPNGRKGVQRQVTLGGESSSTQVDVSSVLLNHD